MKLLIALLVPTLVFSANFNLTESSLKKMARGSSPALSEIETSFLSSQVSAKEVKDKFGFELYAGYGHTNTKEKALIPFQPIFGTANQYKLGVKKYTKYGAVIDLNTSVDTRSSSSSTTEYKDLTTTTYNLGLQVDLWKDFLGRLTRAQISNLEDIKSKDELQLEISKHTFWVNVRRLYWSLVANQEKINITKNLLSKAKLQAKDARRRKASSISDKAEVARFESLVHQRKGTLLFLDYEKEALFKNLRDLFPELNKHELTLDGYNLNKTVLEVLACTSKINKQVDTPFNYTSYDEITKILKKVKTRQLKIDNAYDDASLSLNLNLKQVGVGSELEGSDYNGNYSDSIDDLKDNDRNAVSGALTLTIPFGEDKAATSKIKEKLSEKQFSSSIDKLDANILSTHRQVKNSVRLLTSVIREQKENSKKLRIRVKEMQKKYEQARIPEYILIQDQDESLQIDLTVVDTQLRIVNTMLDYFSVFDKFPCHFNRSL